MNLQGLATHLDGAHNYFPIMLGAFPSWNSMCLPVLVSIRHFSVAQELNVRSLVLAEDDSKYGISLQAEPDSDRLGKRLKADFKTVAPAVKG